MRGRTCWQRRAAGQVGARRGTLLWQRVEDVVDGATGRRGRTTQPRNRQHTHYKGRQMHQWPGPPSCILLQPTHPSCRLRLGLSRGGHSRVGPELSGGVPGYHTANDRRDAPSPPRCIGVKLRMEEKWDFRECGNVYAFLESYRIPTKLDGSTYLLRLSLILV